MSPQGCVSGTVVTQYVDPCTGIEDNVSLTSIKLFPNPANEFFNIKGIQSLSGVLIRIYNQLGDEILDLRGSGANMEVSTANFLPGIYTIKLFYKEDKYITRICIIH